MSAGDKQALISELTDYIRQQLRVRVALELVPPFSLPRESGKTSLIETGIEK